MPTAKGSRMEKKLKKITMFYLEECPYCANAFKAIEQLKKENAKYACVELETIEEHKNEALADSYDYWAVPSLFFGKEKQYECHFGAKYDEIYENVKRVYDKALKD
ncbi:MAG: glutaredoxin domain-containing protein [Eubacterium sp.]|nr:glutaredoxin domain-containing protein [Eubacterium sp.]